MKTLMKHWLVPVAGLTLGVVANDASAQAAPPPLELKVYNADAASFNVNAVLVSGATDAVLVDTGFTRADAHRIAAMVLDSKKKLTTIYVSQADPDFYFGAGVLKQVFPDAKLVASAATVKKIEATLAAKLAVWGPRMGANAPVNPPVPEAMAGNTITPRRPDARSARPGRHAAAPQLRLDSVDQGDRRRRQRVRRAARLDGRHADRAGACRLERQALRRWPRCNRRSSCPATCRPARRRTLRRSPTPRAYLARFEPELAKAPNAAALIEAMKAAYPNAGLMVALDIGAKVNKGEMKW